MKIEDVELVIIGSNEYAQTDTGCFFRSGLEQQIDDLAQHVRVCFHYSPKSTHVFSGYQFGSRVIVRPFSVGHHESHRELWNRKKEYWDSIKTIYKNHPNAVFMIFFPDSYIGVLSVLYLKMVKAKFFVRVTANQLEEMRVRGDKWYRKILYVLCKIPFLLVMKWLLRGVVQVYTGRKIFWDNELCFSIHSSNLRQEDIVQRRLLRTGGVLELLFVGRFDPLKGLDYLLDSLGYIQHPFTLRIVGFGTDAEKEYYLQKIYRSPQKNNIQFVGQVKYGRDLFAHYDRADIVLVPSLYEAQGKTTLEAMARGAAVIATSVGGIPLVVKDRWNGLLVPPKKNKELAEAVNLLVNDKQLHESIVAHGYVTASSATVEIVTKITLQAINLLQPL